MKRIIINVAKSILPYNFRVRLRKLNWKLKYYTCVVSVYNKQAVFCPIQEKKYKCFIPEINGIWESLISPGNGARSRHRLVWLYLKNNTRIFTSNCTLLHIAPEFCYFDILRNVPTLSYLPGDKMEKGYGNQSPVAYMDLLDLKLSDASVDYVLCNHVLEHIPDDQTAIKEVFRVLKKEGIAIITVPIDEGIMSTYEDFSITSPAERANHFGQWDHVRWYSVDIIGRFEKAGFGTVDLIRYSENFSASDYCRFGLCNDLILIAQK